MINGFRKPNGFISKTKKQSQKIYDSKISEFSNKAYDRFDKKLREKYLGYAINDVKNNYDFEKRNKSYDDQGQMYATMKDENMNIEKIFNTNLSAVENFYEPSNPKPKVRQFQNIYDKTRGYYSKYSNSSTDRKLSSNQNKSTLFFRKKSKFFIR